MPVVVLHPRAEAQIIDVLDYTREEFGAAKYVEYRDLTALALRTLEVAPTQGKRRPEIHGDAWTYHIARPGRRARHLFLYRIPGRRGGRPFPVRRDGPVSSAAPGMEMISEAPGFYPLILRLSGS